MRPTWVRGDSLERLCWVKFPLCKRSLKVLFTFSSFHGLLNLKRKCWFQNSRIWKFQYIAIQEFLFQFNIYYHWPFSPVTCFRICGNLDFHFQISKSLLNRVLVPKRAQRSENIPIRGFCLYYNKENEVNSSRGMGNKTNFLLYKSNSQRFGNFVPCPMVSNSNLSFNTCSRFSSTVFLSKVVFCSVRESVPMISMRKLVAIIPACTTTSWLKLSAVNVTHRYYAHPPRVNSCKSAFCQPRSVSCSLRVTK